MLFLRRRLVSLLVAAVSVPTLLAGCQTPAAAPSLEARSDPAGAPSIARGPFVAAANPLAVEAGMKVLRRGGSAVDAAVAVQAVLGLVEPQSSGLGGGAFLMSYEAKTGRITAYDGRETAPASATPELFYEDGEPLPFIDAILSGRSAGAPGAVAMLAMAHQDQGRLAWRDLFDDAERLARDGFVVSPRLAGMINGSSPQAKTRWATALFTGPDGRRYRTGDVMRNPAYARTVQALATEGPGVFYGGRIGREIARTVAEGPRPGGLTEADIAAYRPLRRDALCRPYRIYVICVPPPPSSGVALLQFLAMAEHTPDIQKGADSPEAWVAFTRQRGDNLPTGVVRRVGSICEYLDEKSGRVYYHDSETSSTNWARPAAFADEEDRAHAVAPRSPNRLGGLRNALRRRADVLAIMERLKGASIKLVPPEKRHLVELIDAPPDFAEALSQVQAAVEADDAAETLACVRRLVVAYDNLGKRVDDAAARALHALVEPVLGLVRRGV